MRIRSEFHIRREPVTLYEDVDITTYDRVGKYGIDAQAGLSNSGEFVDFMFLESGSESDVVTVAFFGSTGLQAQLKLSGTGSKGSHLQAGTNGVIQASTTDSSLPLAAGEFGIAMEDWSDGDAVECQLFRGPQ